MAVEAKELAARLRSLADWHDSSRSRAAMKLDRLEGRARGVTLLLADAVEMLAEREYAYPKHSVAALLRSVAEATEGGESHER